jgi:hypothetical protein
VELGLPQGPPGAVGTRSTTGELALNKCYQQKPCPFISSITPNGTYMAFGPHYEHSRIHRSDESVSIELLVNYLDSFKSFIQASVSGLVTR